ncbi:MAG: flagellar assembly peptidoglycan hydrolase FlgJ [Betaproteobacteria bacterium]|nr:flagellar assembly peptidoglycan hydrolase FlgJ [Betaproteobacteria bacterium]
MAAAPDVSVSSRFAFDARSLGDLRAQAKKDPDAALKQAATQFEAVFMRALLKSMRDAIPQEDTLTSDAGKMYTSMYDDQIAQKLAERGLGIADIMVKQLAPRAAGAPGASGKPRAVLGIEKAAGRLESAARAGAAAAPAAGGAASVAEKFIEKTAQHAAAAAQATGVPARFILGQAALESGWGAREIRGAGGSQSFNLFGVKAGKNWKGAVVEANTTEYVNGIPRRALERFRAYGSYQEAFADYAQLLKANPRYAQVLSSARDAESFASGMQRAGYATDPRYADKLARVIKSASLQSVAA